MNVLKVMRRQSPDKRFQREEFGLGWRLSQVVYAASVVFVLDAHTHPYMWWLRQFVSEFKQAL
jgi:hypothetical protein